MTPPSDRLAELQTQESLALTRFDRADAWRLGNLVAEEALAAGHAVAIDIRKPGLILFRAAFAGTTADQEEWLRKKAAVALRFECSSALVAERLSAAGIDAAAAGWLDPAEYALTGGAVPIRVVGAGVVAVATASGLSSDEDHDLVVRGIERLKTEQAE